MSKDLIEVKGWRSECAEWRRRQYAGVGGRQHYPDLRNDHWHRENHKAGDHQNEKNFAIKGLQVSKSQDFWFAIIWSKTKIHHFLAGNWKIERARASAVRSGRRSGMAWWMSCFSFGTTRSSSELRSRCSPSNFNASRKTRDRPRSRNLIIRHNKVPAA